MDVNRAAASCVIHPSNGRSTHASVLPTLKSFISSAFPGLYNHPTSCRGPLHCLYISPLTARAALMPHGNNMLTGLWESWGKQLDSCSQHSRETERRLWGCIPWRSSTRVRRYSSRDVNSDFPSASLKPTESKLLVWEQEDITFESSGDSDSQKNMLSAVFKTFPTLRFIEHGLIHLEILTGPKGTKLIVGSNSQPSEFSEESVTRVTLSIRLGRINAISPKDSKVGPSETALWLAVPKMDLSRNEESSDITIRATLHGKKYLPKKNKERRQVHEVNYHREGIGDAGERKDLLDQALRQYGVNVSEVAGDEDSFGDCLGNPAQKAYLSFIYPKPTAASVHSVKKHAKLIAAQIMMLQREHKAKLAAYLRNIDNAQNQVKYRHELVIVLDNVRSAFNVGQIFRTAETAAVHQVITCGITPHPPHPQINKTALGAEEYVPTRHFTSTLEAVKHLKEEGYLVVGMETTSRSKSYSNVSYPKPTALVVGNEVFGICTEVMDQCDLLVQIPCFGVKNSLNVAAAVAANVFEVVRQWHQEEY
ncbi:hypothetical protein AAMO2058_000029600 [Amorphochlora amoebiformis]